MLIPLAHRSAASLGRHFATLARASAAGVPVTPAVAISDSRLRLAASGADAATFAIRTAREALGATLPELLARLQAVRSEFSLPAGEREELAMLLRGRLLAVVPSASAGRRVSAADIEASCDLATVQSVGDVDGAVRQVWLSHFSPRSVAYRLRRGEPRDEVAVHCVLQAVVPAAVTGLSVLRNGHASEHLTARLDRPAGLGTWAGAIRASGRVADSAPPALDGLVPTLLAIGADGAVVVWQWDGDIFELLELRPSSEAARIGAQSGECSCLPLYEGGDASQEVKLGEIAPIYRHYRRKRREVLLHAAQLGATVPRSAFASVDETALATDAVEPLRRWIASVRSGSVVIDFSKRARQVIVPKDEVMGLVASVCGARAGGPLRATMTLREFWTGDYGAVAYADPSRRRVFIEYSSDGLVGLNRGDARCVTVVMKAPGMPSPDAVPTTRPAWSVLYRATLSLSERLPRRQFEWVLAGPTALVVDWSPRSGHVPVDASRPSTRAARVIHDGSASGPVLRVADDASVRALSVAPIVSIDAVSSSEAEVVERLVRAARACPSPPVVFASRPYAILAVLMQHVVGFVFEEGGVFSHLGVLLREAGVPSVVLGRPLPDGRVARLAGATLETDNGNERRVELECRVGS